MELVEVLKQFANYDGVVVIPLAVYIINLLNNHLTHRLASIEKKIDNLPCKKGECTKCN
jgi:hypothetical protein